MKYETEMKICEAVIVVFGLIAFVCFGIAAFEKTFLR